MKRICLIICAVFLCSGCAMLAKMQLPTVLVSNELQWTIPKGTEFVAMQKPKYPKLTKFTADEDLAIVYKGNLLELEQEADARVIKAARAAKVKGVVFGGLGSILAIVAGFVTSKLLKKK